MTYPDTLPDELLPPAELDWIRGAPNGHRRIVHRTHAGWVREERSARQGRFLTAGTGLVIGAIIGCAAWGLALWWCMR